MYSDQDKQKMKTFMKRLMLNPCLINETPLAIEEHIILFFLQNFKALQVTLSSPDFFPRLSWDMIQQLFIECLLEEINQELQKILEKVIFKLIDFNFINKILNRQLETNKFQNQLLDFFSRLLTRFEIRRTINPVLKVILYSIIDQYIKEIYNKRAYTAREIERVERLRLTREETADYLKVNLLLGVIGFVRNDLDGAPLQRKLTVTGEIKFANLNAQLNHYQLLVDKYLPFLSHFPRPFLEKSLKMHISFLDDQYIPATCRLAKIFYFLGKSYNPNLKIDKGAETFNKSWFQTQRRNYKYYGFDNNILDELYRISAENYW